MTSNEYARRLASARSKTASGLAGAASLLLAGCSADIANFDFPAFSLTDQQTSQSASTGSIPRPSEPMLGSRAGLIGSNGAAHSSDAVNQTELAPVASASPQQPQRYAALTDNAGAGPNVAPVTAAPSYEPRQPVAAAPPRQPITTAAAPASNGSTIIVKPGDTLYSLSKRHGIGLDKLIAANGLKGTALKPGQQLVLPGGSTSVATAPTPASTPAPTVAAAPALAAAWNGTYTVKPGEVLYSIARQLGVKTADLQAANGISDPRKVRPGTVLKVPGNGSSPTVAAAPEVPAVQSAEPRKLAMAPTILNSPAPPASQPQTATDAQPAPSLIVQPPPPAAQSMDLSKLRWPVQGKVIANFGQRPDGTHNDGVNVSVPMGTRVHAAEEGTVAYAGNELKGYGNLVLIRHDNGWVTAYAHAEDVLVKRGDRVRRGDVIAKAGKSGQVDQPQLHFELRQGSKPVDPVPYLESL